MGETDAKTRTRQTGKGENVHSMHKCPADGASHLDFRVKDFPHLIEHFTRACDTMLMFFIAWHNDFTKSKCLAIGMYRKQGTKTDTTPTRHAPVGVGTTQQRQKTGSSGPERERGVNAKERKWEVRERERERLRERREGGRSAII